MVDHNIWDLTVNFTQKSIEPVLNTITPTVLLTYQVSVRTHAAQPHNVIITNATLELMVVSPDDRTYVLIGNAQSERLHYRWNVGEFPELKFILPMDHYVLKQIEKVRNGDNLKLRPVIKLLAYPDNSPTNIKEYDLGVEHWNIPKSHWTEGVLQKIGYRNVAMIEIPVLEYPALKETIDKMNLAWRKYSAGDYEDVLTQCRKIHEDISAYLRQLGFEIEKVDEAGNKKPSTDWKKFFGSDTKGEIFNLITPQKRRFVGLGAHTGSVISGAEAYFALLETFSILNYVIANLQRKERE